MPDNEIQKEEKLRELFLQQKQTLDIFLEHHTITKEQYETSLNKLKEKMNIYFDD